MGQFKSMYEKQNENFQQLIFTLLDYNEWGFFTRNEDEDESPLISQTKIKEGLFSKSKNYLNVFTEDEEAELFFKENQLENCSFVLMKPKRMLYRLMNEMTNSEVEGVIFNNCLEVSKEKIELAYNKITREYFIARLDVIKRIQDTQKSFMLYMRSFFTLPNVYALALKDDKGDTKLVRITAENIETSEREDSVFLFNSRIAALKFVQDMNLDQAMFAEEIPTHGFIYEALGNNFTYVWVNSLHKLPLEEFGELERLFSLIGEDEE